ncbi:hypothetical protein PsYK624_069440 [Phanerochaete sordida]|uniref:Uncharacterized protein n=1 Tax=Phanerochaete sordida TaxID=48140 RepID=A0A9P3GA58_9APHY|nr:hypothetical protein PsYK624_069440 [Phanerochaete sordida]
MRGALIGGIYLLLVSRSAAQSTSPGVTCPSSFAWASNNLNQNICTIASYLQAACEADPASFVLGAPASGHYGPPTTKNKCTCSMVYYNAINACALCQGGKTLQWTVSVAPCNPSDITVAGYPEAIPPGTAVPAWAFLDITSGNVFDPDAAKIYTAVNDTMVGEAPPPAPPSSSPTTAPPATHSDVQTPQPSTPSSPQPATSVLAQQSSPIASSVLPSEISSSTQPRSSASPSSTGPATRLSGSISSVPTAASSGFSNSPSPSAQASDVTLPSGAESNTKHTSNTGAIVGGVVGGLAVVAALALVVILLRRRRASVDQVMAADPFEAHRFSRAPSPASRIVRRAEKLYKPDEQPEHTFADAPHPTSSVFAQASVARLLPAEGPPPEYASVAGQ